MRPGLLRRDLLVVLLTLGLLLAWEASSWDRSLARPFGSAAGFVWRDSWWAAHVLHDGGRWLGAAVLLLVVVDAARPLLPGPDRRERLFWLTATVAVAVLVPALKRLSRTSCPWELTEFGGTVPYVPHWLIGLNDGGPGHCFPSGHAVTAFAFFGVYFLWRPHRPVLARRVLAGVGATGLVFGLTQLARGAHFPSHTLWSAWLCWTLFVLAAAASLHTRPVIARNEAIEGDCCIETPLWERRPGAMQLWIKRAIAARARLPQLKTDARRHGSPRPATSQAPRG